MIEDKTHPDLVMIPEHIPLSAVMAAFAALGITDKKIVSATLTISPSELTIETVNPPGLTIYVYKIPITYNRKPSTIEAVPVEKYRPSD